MLNSCSHETQHIFCSFHSQAMKLFTQSLVIVMSTLILYFIISNKFISYTPYILAFFFVLAIIYGLIKKRRKHVEVFSANSIEIFTILTSVLLIVFLTDGIKSPIFFLTYFLLFGITFIFEPLTIFIFLIGMLFLFGPQTLEGDVIGNSIKLGSLLVLAPIAYFFGREHKKREKLSNQVKINADDIIKSASELLKTKDTSEQTKKTEKIIEDAHKLKNEASHV